MVMTSIARLDTARADFERRLETLLALDEDGEREIEAQVRAILEHVRLGGDRALLQYTQQFDRIDAATVAALEIGPDRIEVARDQVSRDQRQALELAARRIKDYHSHQKQESWRIDEADGTFLGQRVTPLQRVGVYVPGGKASYPSSVLMNAIPAAVAGVEEIIMTVPAPGGDLNPLILVAAKLAGVSRIFTIGGAQAIAALTYGTETIPAVDKIVGPGNRYVAAAKKAVFGRVGLDMVAGPSEIVIVSDGASNPDWMAMDLFAQAEHDETAQAILISFDQDLLDRVDASIDRLLPTLERAEIVRAALAGRGALIKVKDIDEALILANRLAPEHLQLALEQPESVLDRITQAGAIFLGRHTPEALGDYCAGANHVLPTSTSARFSSPLGVYDFQKRTSVIACSPEGASRLAKTASVLARSESLTAHARSAEYRIRD